MSTVVQTDALAGLAALDPASIDAVVTSPPYWQQRVYGAACTWPAVTYVPLAGCPAITIPAWEGELGQEEDPAAYVGHLVALARCVRRALVPTGNFLLNLGDKFLEKQLQFIPARVALAIQADGWIAREEIVWAKAAPKPEKANDRCTRAHEMIYHFTLRHTGYYWDGDALATPVDAADPHGRPQRRRALELWRAANLTDDHLRALRAAGLSDTGKSLSTQTGAGKNRPATQALAEEARRALGGYAREMLTGSSVNRRSVWTPQGGAYAGTHSAVMPWALAADLVIASTPAAGRVCDPFCGAATVLSAAQAYGREGTGFEVNTRSHAEALRNLRAAPQGLALVGQ